MRAKRWASKGEKKLRGKEGKRGRTYGNEGKEGRVRVKKIKIYIINE